MEINIQQRLRDLRKENRFSQAQVAEFCGIKPKTYNHYETGRAIPSLSNLLKLTTLYGLSSLDELLGIKFTAKKLSILEGAYYSAPLDKRKIVDFVLNLNC